MIKSVGFVCGTAGLYMLVVLLAPLSAWAAANDTILFDDFDTVKPDWKQGSGLPYTIRDGFVFLNVSASAKGEWCYIRSVRDVRYSGLEMRLRWLGNPEGWGVWGFKLNPNELKFSWASNKSEPEFQGLTASSILYGEFELLHPIPGVDVTDWHTYTVIWEEGNGTFLIDGERVATTDRVSKYQMGMYLSNSGLRLAGTLDHVEAHIVELLTDQCMQIDYIRHFAVPEPVLLSILSVLGLILLPALLRQIRKKPNS